MNSIRHVKISCPSRLHLGLFAVGQAASFQFGGVGLMIDQPRTEIAIRSHSNLKIAGPESTTMREAVERWFVWQNANLITEKDWKIDSADDLPVCLEMMSIPARHQGLGSGTQIAFATALALNSGFRLGVPSAEEFAIALRRGKRSAIGSFGFFLGGILIDRGKATGDPLAPLDFRTDFPVDWPILLILERSAKQVGLSGAKELAAFDKLPPTQELDRKAMVKLVQNEIMSGLMQRNYELFGEGLYQFGRRSGLYFESVQCGAYHSQPVADLVEFVRSCGCPAVGQSSWGPGVFGVLPSRDRIADLVNRIEQRFPERYQIISTRADNHGVIVSDLP